jgi:hypothetical protein
MKRRLMPGNRILEKIYPFIEPMIHDNNVAGITSKKLFRRFGDSLSKALVKPSNEGCFGRTHIEAMLISTNGLKLVATSI